MNIPTDNHKQRIEVEERYKVFLEFQEEIEKEGIIPHTPALFLRRYRYILEYTSEVLIGFIIGISSMVVVFFIANMLLKLEF